MPRSPQGKGPQRFGRSDARWSPRERLAGRSSRRRRVSRPGAKWPWSVIQSANATACVGSGCGPGAASDAMTTTTSHPTPDTRLIATRRLRQALQLRLRAVGDPARCDRDLAAADRVGARTLISQLVADRQPQYGRTIDQGGRVWRAERALSPQWKVAQAHPTTVGRSHGRTYAAAPAGTRTS